MTSPTLPGDAGDPPAARPARVVQTSPTRRHLPRKRLFVTTALPYANGSFHVGHIMEYIQADIWVRFQRMLGHEVHFVCADDAHGAPIMLKAESEGVTPQGLVARIAAERPKYLNGYHIAFDHWHSTESPENVELSSRLVTVSPKTTTAPVSAGVASGGPFQICRLTPVIVDVVVDPVW